MLVVQSEFLWTIMTIVWCGIFPMVVLQFDIHGYVVVHLLALCHLEVARHVKF